MREIPLSPLILILNFNLILIYNNQPMNILSEELIRQDNNTSATVNNLSSENSTPQKRRTGRPPKPVSKTQFWNKETKLQTR